MWVNSHYGSHFFRTLSFLLTDGFIWLYATCWTLIRFSRNQGVIIPYLNNWLTDLVYVPLICAVAHWVLLNALRSPERIRRFPLIQILVLAAFVAIVFEGIMPHYTDYNVADPIDVLCYFIGGIFYYFLHQKYILRKYQTSLSY